MLFGDGPEGHKFANSSVSKNNIDSALHLGNSLVKAIKVRDFGNVALNATNIAADCLHRLVEFLLAPACDEDIRTLFDEKFCRSQPNSFRAAGDDGDLAFELFRHCLSPFLPSWKLPSSESLSGGSLRAIRSQKDILHKSFKRSRCAVLRRTRLQWS